MSGKITGAFNDEQFEAFCQELMALPKKERTLEGIAALFQARTGVYASPNAAKSFKAGPFARYIEKLHHGRETREALCAAAGTGVHPLDALEEAAVIELQDHLTESETIDVDWLGKQLLKLRTSISMRESERRKDENLARLQSETEKKLEVADKQLRLRDEQIAKFAREKADWQSRQEKIQAAVDTAAKKGGLTADTRKLIEAAMKGEAAA